MKRLQAETAAELAALLPAIVLAEDEKSDPEDYGVMSLNWGAPAAM